MNSSWCPVVRFRCAERAYSIFAGSATATNARRDERSVKAPKPKTRSEAAAPRATQHLTPGQKRALDLQAEAEHAEGSRREKLTREIKRAAR
jgi:hypothetical protein